MHNYKEANGEITYAIPRDNGEVTLGGTYVSIVYPLYFTDCIIECKFSIS